EVLVQGAKGGSAAAQREEAESLSPGNDPPRGPAGAAAKTNELEPSRLAPQGNDVGPSLCPSHENAREPRFSLAGGDLRVLAIPACSGSEPEIRVRRQRCSTPSPASVFDEGRLNCRTKRR